MNITGIDPKRIETSDRAADLAQAEESLDNHRFVVAAGHRGGCGALEQLDASRHEPTNHHGAATARGNKGVDKGVAIASTKLQGQLSVARASDIRDIADSK
jgi:hypothetical protein